MNRKAAVLCTLLVLPCAAFAQEGLGLDLSEDAQKSDPNEPKEGASSSSSQSSSSSANTNEPSNAAASAALTGERDITQEDRVKSVQRKVYLKKSRFELNPSFFTTVNDPYYAKAGLAARVAYHLTDSLALAVRGSLFQLLPTDDVRRAKLYFQSRIYYSVPEWSLMGDFEWSPLYGKVAFFNSILHLDGYIVGGLGALRTDTSALPERGLNPAADVGVGFRFVAKDYLAVNVALINTLYVDQPKGTTKGLTQNVMMLNAGVSLFFPFRSTGRESE